MGKLGFSFLLVAAMALSAGAQSANQQYRSSQDQDHSRPAQQTKSSPSTSNQSGAQSAASASASGSAHASANAGGTSAGVSSGMTINTELQTTIDARKCHPGQRVVAKTTQDVKEDGHVVLRRGTQLIGHVTEAQARTKANAESSVAIVFDEAVMKKGEEVPFHATIQALAAAQSTSAASLDNDMMEPSGAPMGSGGGSMGGGVAAGAGPAVGSAAGATRGMAGGLPQTANSAVGATSATAASAGGNLRGLNAAGQLTSASSGVIGMNDINLTSAAANSTNGSVITSAKHNVHLSSGTQMLLRVNGN